jgi:NADPH:quinone reductase-like Zn-dependent oxidoreductase
MKAVQYDRFITKVDEVLPLAMAADAHRRLEDRSVRGVIVLDPTVWSEGNA